MMRHYVGDRPLSVTIGLRQDSGPLTLSALAEQAVDGAMENLALRVDFVMGDVKHAITPSPVSDGESSEVIVTLNDDDADMLFGISGVWQVYLYLDVRGNTRVLGTGEMRVESIPRA